MHATSIFFSFNGLFYGNSGKSGLNEEKYEYEETPLTMGKRIISAGQKRF